MVDEWLWGAPPAPADSTCLAEPTPLDLTPSQDHHSDSGDDTDGHPTIAMPAALHYMDFPAERVEETAVAVPLPLEDISVPTPVPLDTPTEADADSPELQMLFSMFPAISAAIVK